MCARPRATGASSFRVPELKLTSNPGPEHTQAGCHAAPEGAAVGVPAAYAHVLDVSAPERAADCYRPPRTPEEGNLCEIFADRLGLERVGIADTFFELGGHSLLAMRVISRLRSASGLDIPLRVFFENATVAALAEYIDGARCSGVKTPLAPLAVDHEELVL